MQPWIPFYSSVATAAAALLGLLFVAVSLNASTALGTAHQTSRALSEQALQNFLTTLLISLTALFPTTSASSFGRTSSYLSVASTSVTLWRVVRSLRQPAERERFVALRRHAASLLGFVLLLYSAIQTGFGGEDHLTLEAAALLVLASSATTSAWELLLRLSGVRSLSGRSHGEAKPSVLT